MSRSHRARLSYANVVGTLALFVALGGSSYAALKVTGLDVVDGSLTDADIAAANTDGAASTPSLRTLGVGAQQAASFPSVLANDGSGSTLDADTLDGLDSTAFGETFLGRVTGPQFSDWHRRFAPPQGRSAYSLTESEVSQLFPNTSVIALDLAVKVTAGLDPFESPPGRLTFTLRDDGADTAVSCAVAVVTVVDTYTCDSGAATAVVAPGGELSLQITSDAVIVAPGAGEGLQFAWRATAQEADSTG